MKKWLKYGLIGGIILVVIYYALAIWVFYFPGSYPTFVFCDPNGISPEPTWIFLNSGCIYTFSQVLLPGILWFLIGAVIGGIVGKIKSKKEVLTK